MLTLLYGPFYAWGSIASRLEPLWGGSLLFTTKVPEIPGTHFIDLEGWMAESTLESPSDFEHGTPGLGIQQLMVTKIQTMRKLNNPTIISLTENFLTIVRFNLFEW